MPENYDIGLLTCDKFPELQSDFHFLKSELEAQGLKVRPVIWNQMEVDWSNFKNLLFCSVWDYCNNYSLFHKWLTAREAQCNLINSSNIIRWNLNKSYLQHFEKNSIPVIPTKWIYEQNQIFESAFLMVCNISMLSFLMWNYMAKVRLFVPIPSQRSFHQL